jgi:hypothetical protein
MSGALVIVLDNDSSTDGGDEPPLSFGGKMHDKHIRRRRKVIHDLDTITSATLQPDKSPTPARSYAESITETDQDTAEPEPLFRPQLHFVPE